MSKSINLTFTGSKQATTNFNGTKARITKYPIMLKTRLFYHVTLANNLANITKIGLTPRIGKNSQAVNESINRIYLFNKLSDVDTALGQWLGDLFKESDTLVILVIKLRLDDYYLDYNHEKYDYESTYYRQIPASQIFKVLTESYEPLNQISQY